MLQRSTACNYGDTIPNSYRLNMVSLYLRWMDAVINLVTAQSQIAQNYREIAYILGAVALVHGAESRNFRSRQMMILKFMALCYKEFWNSVVLKIE